MKEVDINQAYLIDKNTVGFYPCFNGKIYLCEEEKKIKIIENKCNKKREFKISQDKLIETLKFKNEETKRILALMHRLEEDKEPILVLLEPLIDGKFEIAFIKSQTACYSKSLSYTMIDKCLLYVLKKKGVFFKDEISFQKYLYGKHINNSKYKILKDIGDSYLVFNTTQLIRFIKEIETVI